MCAILHNNMEFLKKTNYFVEICENIQNILFFHNSVNNSTQNESILFSSNENKKIESKLFLVIIVAPFMK